jgi:hypothetical protein
MAFFPRYSTSFWGHGMHVKPPSVKQAGAILAVVPNRAMLIPINSIRIKPTVFVKPLLPGLELDKRPLRPRLPAIIVVKPLLTNTKSPIPIVVPKVMAARHNLEFIADNARVAHFIIRLATGTDFDRWFLFEGSDGMTARGKFVAVIDGNFSFATSIPAESPSFRGSIEKESELVIRLLPIVADL